MEGVINIRGKQYQTVAYRVHEFRKLCSISDGWSIRTRIHTITEDVVVMVAEIVDPADRVVATGIAEEVRSSSNINKTSAVENGETSAIGRALAAAGFGGERYSTADEITRAIRQQEHAPAGEDHDSEFDAARRGFMAALNEIGHKYETVKGFCEWAGMPKPSTIGNERRGKMLAYLKSEKGRKLFSEYMEGS